jgi:drug/metabolite transporter (DMT)-like permease
LSGQALAMSRQDWTRVIVAGLMLFVAGNGLVNFAERTVNSGAAAVLAATTPLWIGFFEMFWPGGERLTGRGWLGLVLGLGGVLLILVDKLTDAGTFFQDVGPLLVLGSACSWSVGSLVLRHHRLSCSHLAAASYQMIIGGGGLALIGCFLGEVDQVPGHITAGAVIAFVYLLIVGSLVGFVSFNWLLGHVPAAKVGTYAYVNPMVAVVAGWWLADEPISAWFVAGFLVILTGVALVRRGERPRSTTRDIGDEAPQAAPASPVVCVSKNTS